MADEETRPIKVNQPKVTRPSEVSQEDIHPDAHACSPTLGLGGMATGGRFWGRKI